jgi:hypothetical protein
MIVVLEGGFCKENCVELMGRSRVRFVSLSAVQFLYNSNL